MSPIIAGLVGIFALLVLVFLGVYVGASMAIVGFLGTIAVAGSFAAFSNLYIVPFGTTNDFGFAVLPLFVLMGELVSQGGIVKGAYEAARAWIGHIRGGLAMASVGACALFAATSGSSVACAAVMGKVAFPEMKRNKYASTLASGCIIAGGSMGIMIPPSMSFISIGILTDTSIGKLFVAGIIPGITQALFYVVTIFLMCRFNPNLGPTSPDTPFKQKLSSTVQTWPIFVLFILVIGGIYAGIFSPTESAAVGCVAAFIIAMSQRQLSRSKFFESLTSTVKVAGMLAFLLVGAFMLNRFLALSRLPFVVSGFIAGLGLNRFIILGIVLIIYIILGMFFDIVAVLILTIPIFFPVMTTMGFNPIWYGVLMCRVAEMGFITPPFGLNIFVLVGTIDVPLSTMFRGIMPFVIADVFHLALLVAVPSISLFIPSLM